MHYSVVETFQSIQGEGRYTGFPASFIRLAGCPNKCEFCDTNIQAAHGYNEDDLVRKVDWSLPLIVITGGEPTIYDLVPLLAALDTERRRRSVSVRFCLETSGIRPIPPTGLDYVTLSPKKGKWIPYQNFPRVSEVKWLVPMWDLSDILEAREAFSRNTIHFVQPINDMLTLNKKHVQLATEYIMKEPWLRLSIQLQKVIGVR